MSAHSLIIGQTLSGKSYFCNQLARAAVAAGKTVQIIDPTGSFGEEFDALDAFCDDVDELLDEPSHVFLDEASAYLDVGHRKNHRVLTKGRHNGWRVYVICQRFNSVAPIVRDQCGEIFIFNVSREAAKELQALYGVQAAILIALRQGEYVRIFWEKGEQKIKVYKRADLDL